MPKKSASLSRDRALPALLDLADHLVHRPVAELEPVHQRLGAEGAALVAAARGLDEGAVDVAVLLHQVVAGHRHVDHGMQRVGAVDALDLAAIQVVEQLGHDQLGLADHHGVAVLQRLLRHEARVHPADDHGHALGTVTVGDLVAPLDVARHGRDADHVDLQVEVDVLDVLVGHHDFVAVLRNHCRNRQQTRQRRIERPVEVHRARRELVGLGIDEVDDSCAHAYLRSRDYTAARQPCRVALRAVVIAFIPPTRTAADDAAQYSARSSTAWPRLGTSTVRS